MKKPGMLGTFELFLLLWLYSTSTILLALPRIYAQDGQSALWLLPIISYLYLLPFIWVIIKLRDYFPDKILVEIPVILFGRWAGYLVGWPLAFYILFVTAMALREFTDVVNYIILPETPSWALLLPFLIASAYGAYKGPEAISRANVILLPLTLGAFIFLLFSSFTQAELYFLAPILGPGLDELLISAFLRLSVFIEVAILMALYPNIRSGKALRFVAFYGMAFSAFFMALVLLAYGLNFPFANTQLIGSPLFQLVRNINWGRFLQNLESLFVFTTVLMMIIKISLSLYIAVITFAKTIESPFYQPYVFPFAFITYLYTFMPTDYLTAVKWEYEFLRPYGFISLFILASFLLAVAAWRKKKRPRKKRSLKREPTAL
ncbi:GerAB/ArcD/ProY family transporter [Heliorestis acidaminivorans]|uniref:GerAB/ArcD/ProY family transporter n=1 Tax=Heliorestis acidaminivorans TaxID=553427 RepID=A0A6I0EXN0_9FIRM|nr:endospore germination permease [Heliorestis acidaminivorans]KAB2954549.1 GerAB/ArcD/ProY family transporter [Heliorestis acidaminivorans]